MQTHSRTFLAIALALAVVSPGVHASVDVYGDRAAFMADTAATQATLPYFDGGFGVFAGPYTSLVSGSVRFAQASGPIYFGDASTRLAGGEITIDGTEHLDLSLTGPVHALGFDFVEPRMDPLLNAPFVDSTFTVTLFSGATEVGRFDFNAPDDSAAFIGAWSTLSFDRAQIREAVGGIENEFYGQFYTGVAAPVPEPAVATLWLAGAAALLARRRRNTKASAC